MENYDFISIYTREDAINDGVLVDVTELAKEVGFKIPVAITSSVAKIIENIPMEYNYQDETGRLFDVLFLASLFAKKSKSNEVKFTVYLPHKNKDKLVNEIDFKMIISPGDAFEPVITIMLPYED